MKKFRQTMIIVPLLVLCAPVYAADMDDDVTIQVIKDLRPDGHGVRFLELPDAASRQARETLERTRERLEERDREREQSRGDDQEQHSIDGGREQDSERGGMDDSRSMDSRDTMTDTQSDTGRGDLVGDSNVDRQDIRDEMNNESEGGD
jgi:hypothetical protein